MKRVYEAPSVIWAGHIKNVLEQHGIDCIVRNAFLGGGVGELPPSEALPEVWVMEDADYARARELLMAVLEAPPGRDWCCPRCGESIEGQFGACWSCGEPAPFGNESK